MHRLLPLRFVDATVHVYNLGGMACGEAQGALPSGGYKGVHGEIQGLLSSAKLPTLNPGTWDYSRLAREFLRVKQSVYREEMKRWSGGCPAVEAKVKIIRKQGRGIQGGNFRLARST